MERDAGRRGLVFLSVGALTQGHHGEREIVSRRVEGDIHSYSGPTKPMYAPQASPGGTSIACSPVLRTPRASGGMP